MLKKITAVSLILFGVVVLGMFAMSVAYPTVDASSSNSTDTITLTMADIATHNSSNSCYLVIQNKVYDVSSYIGSHPGGSSAITTNCGKEVSGLFASIHSNFAWDLLNSYYIGTLVQ